MFWKKLFIKKLHDPYYNYYDGVDPGSSRVVASFADEPTDGGDWKAIVRSVYYLKKNWRLGKATVSKLPGKS